MNLSRTAPSSFFPTVCKAFASAAIVLVVAACGGATTTGSVESNDGSVLWVSTLAGAKGESGSVDGKGDAARFISPGSIAVDERGNVFVYDNEAFVIRKITPEGVVSTFAGTQGQSGTADGGIGVGQLGFSMSGLGVDTLGNVYATDFMNRTVRKVSPQGVISTLAGNLAGDKSAQLDGTGTLASFSGPSGLAVDKLFNVHIVDFGYNHNLHDGTGNDRIVKINLAGKAETVRVVTGARGVVVDNSADVSVLGIPSSGNALFISNTTKNTQQTFTFVGKPDILSLAIDGSGVKYVVDGSAIRKIDAAGMISTFAGDPLSSGSNDGLLDQARFNFNGNFLSLNAKIAIDPKGSMYVSDVGNNVIRKISKAYYVKGTISGLASDKAVILKNRGDQLSVRSNGSFTFAMPVPLDEKFELMQVNSDEYACTFNKTTGAVTQTISDITVSCNRKVLPTYSLGGAVSGLAAGQTIELINKTNSNTLVLSSNQPYILEATLANGSAYDAQIKRRPSGQTCTFSNGLTMMSGAIAGANVSSLNINCVTSAHTISVDVSGLNGNLVLRNNGGNSLAINSNARFNFAGTVNFGSAYDLSVSSEPVAQTCRFGIAPSTINATGTVSGDVSVPITCQTKTYSISGNVSGLAASAQGVLELTGLSISTQTFTFTSNAAFTFTNRISHGQSYAVTVKQQPVGQTCVVGGAANGTIGANVSNLTVSCANSAPIFYTVGGTVSGVPNLANISLVMTSTDNVANGQAANGLTNGAYQFLTTVQGGSQFSIAATTPGGVTWTCAVQNGFGQTTTISANVSNADVICTGGSGSGGSGGNGGSGGSGGTGPWTVTVAVTGIDSGESVGLQLLAGSINESQSFSNTGPFQFTNLVPDQTAITVNLQTSPAGKTCQAFAPSTVTGANRNVAVNCSSGSGSGGNGGGIPVIP